jgi:hypothetical protein
VTCSLKKNPIVANHLLRKIYKLDGRRKKKYIVVLKNHDEKLIHRLRVHFVI